MKYVGILLGLCSAVSGTTCPHGQAGICGGIAGFQCPVGTTCMFMGSFPDAAGKCCKNKVQELCPGRCEAAVDCGGGTGFTCPAIGTGCITNPPIMPQMPGRCCLPTPCPPPTPFFTPPTPPQITCPVGQVIFFCEAALPIGQYIPCPVGAKCYRPPNFAADAPAQCCVTSPPPPPPPPLEPTCPKGQVIFECGAARPIDLYIPCPVGAMCYSPPNFVAGAPNKCCVLSPPPPPPPPPGVCPKGPLIGPCVDLCSTDANCPPGLKCCRHGCGKQCKVPGWYGKG